MNLGDLIGTLQAYFLQGHQDLLVIDQDGNDITDVYVGDWAHGKPEIVLTAHIDHKLRRTQQGT